MVTQLLAEHWFDAEVIDEQTSPTAIFPGGHTAPLADIAQYLAFVHPTSMKRAKFNDEGALVVDLTPTISQVQAYLDSKGA